MPAASADGRRLDHAGAIRLRGAQQPLDPAVRGWLPDNSGGLFDEVDLEAAQALLDEAGVEQPVPVRLGWFDNGGNQRRTDQVALTIESCNQIGFDMVRTPARRPSSTSSWPLVTGTSRCSHGRGSPLKSGGVAHVPSRRRATTSATSTSPRSSRSSTSCCITAGSRCARSIWPTRSTRSCGRSWPPSRCSASRVSSPTADDVSNVIYNPSQNGLTFNAGAVVQSPDPVLVVTDLTTLIGAPGSGPAHRSSSQSTHLMFFFILRRMLVAIPILLASSFLMFFLVTISGDPLGRSAPVDQPQRRPADRCPPATAAISTRASSSGTPTG